MTVNSLNFHYSLEESCRIVAPEGYTLNRENNEILCTFKEALGYLIESIDVLREPIGGLSEIQERNVRTLRSMFAFIVYKVKVQDLKQTNQHLDIEELKELKSNLASKICDEFFPTGEYAEATRRFFNNRERLAEYSVQLIALDKKSGRLFLLSKQPVEGYNPRYTRFIIVNLLDSPSPQNWLFSQTNLYKLLLDPYNTIIIPENAFSSFNGTKFPLAYAHRQDFKVVALWETSINVNFLGRKQLCVLEKGKAELYFKSHDKETDPEFVGEIPPLLSDEILCNLKFNIGLPFSEKLPTNGCYFIHQEDLVSFLAGRHLRFKSASSAV